MSLPFSAVTHANVLMDEFCKSEQAWVCVCVCVRFVHVCVCVSASMCVCVCAFKVLCKHLNYVSQLGR